MSAVGPDRDVSRSRPALFHSAVRPESIEVAPGETGTVTIAITNTSEIIEAYHLQVFGLDPAWVEADPWQVSLFPGATELITVTFALPEDYPSSERTITINVRSESNDAFSMNQIDLRVTPKVVTRVALDPIMVTGGRRATLGIVVNNTGNTPVLATGIATDPENLAEFTFDPPRVIVSPDREQVIQVTAQGGRAWFGQPRARTFKLGVLADEPVDTYGTFIQRPRIGRWMLSLLGLLAAAAVFAVVLSYTFNSVVEQATKQAAVLDAISSDQAGGARVPANPGSVSGQVMAPGGGQASSFRQDPTDDSAPGMPGVQVELFVVPDEATPVDPTVPVASAATDVDGRFRLGNLSAGVYKLRLSGAGIDTAWYRVDEQGQPTLTSDVAAATPIAVSREGEVVQDVDLSDLSDGPIVIRGEPVTLTGKVDIEDPSGVTLRLIVPGQIPDPTSPDGPPNALAGTVELSADGTFELPNIPSPGEYMLVVEKPGAAPQFQEISLEPGQGLSDLDITFAPGGGQVTGIVTSARGGALDGAVITATDGSTTYQTVSLSGGEASGADGESDFEAGRFVLRNLPVPGLYTVTITHPEHASQTRQVTLDASDPAFELAADLVPATGSIRGQVSIAGGSPPRGISVALTSGDIDYTTNVASQSTGEGTYSFSGLPAPGAYTLKVTGPDVDPQVRVVTLDPFAGAEQADVGLIVLQRTTRTISGTVTTNDGRPAGQATVVLSGTTSRTLQTADEPIGQFRFSDVEAGTYTLSASLPGAVTLVKLIEVSSSSPPELGSQNFTLGNQASVGGTVTVKRAFGEPEQIEDFTQAVVVRLFEPEQFPQGRAAGEVLTNPDTGAYEFDSLEAGTFVVAVYESITSQTVLASDSVNTTPGEDSTIDLEVVFR